jgi:PucR family transcriptional regulator, proline-responsive transcriptional activator
MEGGIEVGRELDDLAAVLGRSVSLDAPDGTLLGYSTQGTDVDPVRVQAILSRRVPDAVLAYQRTHGVDTATGPVRLPANPGLGMTARTCLPVRTGRHVVAYLWVLDDGAPLDGAGVDALRSCGSRIAALLRPAPAMGIDRLLAELFTDWPRPDLVSELGNRAPRVRSEVLRFAVVASTAIRDGQRAPAPDIPPPAVPVNPAILGTATANGRRLVLLAHPAPTGAVAEAVRPPASDAHVVGYSGPFRADPADAARVPTAAARAIVAADCAATDPALPAAIGWENLGIYRRLLLTTGADGWPDPVPVAAPMLRHTLEVYLDNAGDAARTITALDIHRTTFYYRLERLTSVHGIRLDDGLARTDHHLALKTHRLARARDTYGWTTRFLTRLR